MKKCLIYLDSTQLQNSIDLLEVSRQIFEGQDVETYGVVINHTNTEDYSYFDKIISVVHKDIVDYDVVAISQVMFELQNQFRFQCLLIPATPFGRMLAPRVAMALGVGLVADVTSIKVEGDQLEMIRPAFSGRLLACIKATSDEPVMMSVRQGVFSYEDSMKKNTEIIVYKPDVILNGGIQVLKVRPKNISYDIRESEVLISGGGGITKDFHKLDILAKLLGGQVSASRKIVDKGLAPRSIQVGQSGKTVSPNLYIALGIFGAIQHVEGLKNIDTIIAVNKNRNAPICSLSDIVVEGDAAEFIDLLSKKIAKCE